MLQFLLTIAHFGFPTAIYGLGFARVCGYFLGNRRFRKGLLGFMVNDYILPVQFYLFLLLFQ